MSGADTDREFGRLAHVGFGHLSRLTALAAVAAAVALVVGLTVNPGWVSPALVGLVVFGALSILLHVVSVAFAPETGR